MMGDGRPILTRKKIIVVVVVFLLLFGAGSFALLYKGAGQNADSQEPQLEFAAEGSKIAGIQKLITSGGLSWEQYKKVYRALNEELPKLEPESHYFVYVEESLDFSITGASSDSGAIEIPFAPERGEDPEAGSELDSELAGNIVADEDSLDADDDAMADTLLFTMQAESGTEYAVEVYTAGDLETAKVKIEKK